MDENFIPYLILISVHIGGGSIALVSGMIAMLSRKGPGKHVTAGKTYVYSMLAASISGILLGLANNLQFLFLVGFFSFFLVLIGWRSLYLFRTRGKGAGSFLDYAIIAIGLGFGAWLIYWASGGLLNGSMFSLVPVVFGMISGLIAWGHFRKIRNEDSTSVDWLRSHISGMGGAYIATFTAFLVVNIHMQPGWILWLTPTAIGTYLITKATSKYAPVKRGTK